MRVRKTDAFRKWFKKIRNTVARGLILARIDRLEEGNPGDVRPVGEGLSEMRIDTTALVTGCITRIRGMKSSSYCAAAISPPRKPT
jgi:putative addiction module killer protein